MEKKNINFFKVKDIFDKKNYLFIGKFDELDDIVNKINKNGISSINSNETEIINKYFNVKNIDSNTILVKALINSDDTIDIIKKKIMIYLKKKYSELYLWVTKTDINEFESKFIKKNALCQKQYVSCVNDKIKNYNEALGFEYRNNISKLIINYDITDNISFNPDFTYNMIDNSHVLLNNYNKIKDNVIYLCDVNQVQNKYGEQFSNEHKDFYFPFLKRTEITAENYDSVIKNITQIENNFYNTLSKLEKQDNKNKTYKNIVFSNKQDNINIIDLFNKIELDKIVCFGKFKSSKREELYKLFHEKKENLKIKEDFIDSKNYIVKFDEDLYSFHIEKKNLQNWTQTEMSLKEKFLLKIQTELNPTKIREDELNLKIKYKEDYLDLTIFTNKVVLRYLNKNIKETEIKNIIKFANNIIEKINKKYNTDIIFLNNKDYITLDYTEDILDSKVKLKKIENNVGNYSNYIYKILSEDINSIYIKFKRVNFFTSFENIKRYFIKIKKDNNLSISNFNKAWIKETEKLFNLSETDSLQILSKINETMDTEELKKRPMDIDIDIVITKNISDEGNVFYSLNVKNCDNLEILQNIKNFVNVLFYEAKNKKIAKPKQEEVIFEIKETIITDEDNFG